MRYCSFFGAGLPAVASPQARKAAPADIFLFMLYFFGLGPGPQFTGITSDMLNVNTNLGEESLRPALMIRLLFNLIPAGRHFHTGRTCKADPATGRQMV